jgi:hypothetical protein
VATLGINPSTGLRDGASKGALVEYFYHENPPPEAGRGREAGGAGRPPDEVKTPIF